MSCLSESPFLKLQPFKHRTQRQVRVRQFSANGSRTPLASSLSLSLCVDISVVSPVHSANERRSRLLFMRQWSQVGHSKRHAISREELESWAQSLDNLLASQSQFSLAHNTSWLSPFLNRVHRWTSLPAASINRSRSKSRQGYKWPRLQSLSCWNLLSCFA